MYLTLLQLNPIQAVSNLSNYGPMGLFVALCISAIVYLEKKSGSRDAEVRKELEDQRTKHTLLEQRFDKYQTEDRAKMLEVIQHNTDIMEEVVNELQKNKRII